MDKRIRKILIIGMLALYGCADNQTTTQTSKTKLGEIISLEYLETNNFSFKGGTALTFGRVSGGNVTKEVYKFYIKDLEGEISYITLDCQNVSFIDGTSREIFLKQASRKPLTDQEAVYKLRRGIFNSILPDGTILITVPIENFTEYIRLP